MANVDGFTPLGLAAYFGSADIVDLLLGTAIATTLLDQGAAASATTAEGQTPQALAEAAGHPEVAALLGI